MMRKTIERWKGEWIMKIKYALEVIERYYKDLENKAMIEFNVGSPFASFANPIIGVKELVVDKKDLFAILQNHVEGKEKVICLINLDSDEAYA